MSISALPVRGTPPATRFLNAVDLTTQGLGVQTKEG